MKLISNLKVVHRFALIGAVALTLAVIPATMHMRQAWDLITVAQREVDGISPVRQLMKTVQLSQQHRGLSVMVLSGNAGAQPQLAALQQEVDKAFQALAALAPRLQDAASRASLAKAGQDWAALRSRVGAPGLTAADSFAQHSALVAVLLDLTDLVTDDFGLSLDPEASTYHLIRAVTAELPLLTEALGKARATGGAMLTRAAKSDDETRSLTMYVARAEEAGQAMARAYAKAAVADSFVKGRLDGAEASSGDLMRQAVALARQQVIEPAQLAHPAANYFAVFTRAVDAQLALNEQALDTLETLLDARVKAMRQSLWFMLAAMVAMAGAGLWLGWVAARSIVRELGGEPGEVVAIASAVAQGDLSIPIHVQAGDTTSIVAVLAQVKLNLSRVVDIVRGNANSVATASAQIAQGNQDLSQRTEEQASALQQAAASMEELGTTVKQNAEHAQQANELAQQAASVAGMGGEVVTQVVDRMNGISASSRKIVEIISVIDGIAFQTNILALNAAVEAARAGDQGRGFAVVASEVRNLAQRSAEAAREIKTLITTSVEQVVQGTDLVDKAGRNMQDIVGAIGRVSVMVAEISAASAEQSTGVSQVGEAVAQMDQVTQQNAALVEESAAAADSLRRQSLDLVEAVAVFKLDQSALSTLSAREPAPQAPRSSNVAPLKRPVLVKPAPRPAVATSTGTDDWSSF